MAIRQKITLGNGFDIDYIKIVDCSVIIHIYKDEESRRAGADPVKQERLSLNDLVEIIDEEGEVKDTVSKLNLNLAEALYSVLKSKRFSDAEDC